MEFGQTNSKKDIGVALTKIKSPLNKFSYQLKNGKLDKILFSKKKEKYICGGLYYFKKKILKNIRKKNLDIDKDLILNLNHEKFIYAKYYKNNFLDIGTPKDLKR